MPSNIDKDIVQLSHSDSKFKISKHPIILICDHLDLAANVGGIFRLADGFGVDTVYFIGRNTPFSHKTMKASRSTFKSVDYKIIDNPNDLIMDLKNKGYHIFSLEIANNSQDLSTISQLQLHKVAWVIGNESNGISKGLLQESDKIYHIAMDGHNSSLNVVTATAIALYWTRFAINSIS